MDSIWKKAFPIFPHIVRVNKCKTTGCILDSLHKPQEERELLNFISNFKPRMGFSSLHSTKWSMQRTFLCSACPVNGFTDSSGQIITLIRVASSFYSMDNFYETTLLGSKAGAINHAPVPS